jgi:hypothetical protein
MGEEAYWPVTLGPEHAHLCAEPLWVQPVLKQLRTASKKNNGMGRHALGVNTNVILL